ncbi:MAG: hypothetical protein OEM91_03745 [Hyphomicrobiales bacterium]|nr:hypothetical protein [Hyphomicrobiales bacterium]
MRSKTLEKTPITALIVGLAFALLIAAVASAQAGYSPQGIVDLLYSKGYYNIRIVDIDDDEYEVLACKRGRLYEIEIKRNGRIDDIDREGRCGRRHARAGYHGRDVHVHAPFTGVHVGRGGVHVRAPFVDLYVPRR